MCGRNENFPNVVYGWIEVRESADCLEPSDPQLMQEAAVLFDHEPVQQGAIISVQQVNQNMHRYKIQNNIISMWAVSQIVLSHWLITLTCF
jgi:hypothetical protein